MVEMDMAPIPAAADMIIRYNHGTIVKHYIVIIQYLIDCILDDFIYMVTGTNQLIVES